MLDLASNLYSSLGTKILRVYRSHLNPLLDTVDDDFFIKLYFGVNNKNNYLTQVSKLAIIARFCKSSFIGCNLFLLIVCYFKIRIHNNYE